MSTTNHAINRGKPAGEERLARLISDMEWLVKITGGQGDVIEALDTVAWHARQADTIRAANERESRRQAAVEAARPADPFAGFPQDGGLR